MTRAVLLSTCAVLASVMIFANGDALAQTTDAPVTTGAQDSEEIIVTGSRIRRDPLNQDSPVVTLDQASIAQTGL